MRTPLLFLRLPRLKEWLFKSQEGGGRRYAGEPPCFFLRSSSPLWTTNVRRSTVSAGPSPVRDTADSRAKESEAATSVKLGPVFPTVSLGSLQSSFALTYLRHSASAQAYYCPDVVGLPRCTAPFIPGIQLGAQ